MQTTGELLKDIAGGAYDGALTLLYGAQAASAQRARYERAVHSFEELFGQRPAALFSAPGRTEVGGNHTDHQHGRVLAAGVNLDAVAVASPNDDNVIRVHSEGFRPDVVRLDTLEPQETERNHSASLIRGMAARFREMGCSVGGFDAYTTSDVLGGSGLSSSAAFEVLVGAVLNGLYAGGSVSSVELARMAQYAENVYFGKPSGLLDQMASAVGGFVAMDFEDETKPVIEKIDFDFEKSGYSLCIVDTKGDHADLTDDYADIPAEMRQVASLLGGKVLRDVPEETFYRRLGEIYGKVSNRAVGRAIHFYGDNARVPMQADALRRGDFGAFMKMVVASGRSSAMYLQNVFSSKHPTQQGLTVALALSERMLEGRGAWRVHGGGFAGTIQAYVSGDMLEEYRACLEGIYGQGACHVLRVRPLGQCQVTPALGK